MSFLKTQLIAFISKTTETFFKWVWIRWNIRALFDLCLIWYTVGAVSLPTDPPHHWGSLSAHWCPCQANCMSVTMLSQVLSPVPHCGTQGQDGLMAHHFYYCYLLLPCCVGKTDAERFRTQTPAKPCKAACGSLSQQHLALCLDVGGESSPAA